MQKSQRSALRRFRRVQEFLATNAVAGTTVQLRVLDEVTRQLVTAAEEQDANERRERGESARQRRLREVLRRHHMVPISFIARRVFRGKMDGKFALPALRADNDLLLGSARGMTQAAEAHAEVFVREGLPEDFLDELRAATDALATVLGERVASANRRKEAVELTAKLVKRGVAAVGVLDAVVAPKLEESPDLLAAWRTIKRPIEPGGVSSIGADDVPAPSVVKVA